MDRAKLNQLVQLRMYERALRKGKASALRCTEMEVLTLEATSGEPWGPQERTLLEIAKAAEADRGNIPLIMKVIYDRMKEKDTEWRPCFKALLLSEFLTKKGPKDMVAEMKFTQPHFLALQNYEFIDTANRDQGAHVRERASAMVELLSNEDHLAEERYKARQTGQRRYSGYSPGEEENIARSSLKRASRESGTATKSSEDLFHPYVADGDASLRATRRGIEQLRARQDSAPLVCSAFNKNPDAASNKKGPRRLSEVKVNPAIASALQGISAKQRSSSTACYSGNKTQSADLFFGPGFGSSAAPSTNPGQQQDAFASAPRSTAVGIPQAQPAAPSADEDRWNDILGSAPAAMQRLPNTPAHQMAAAKGRQEGALLSDPFAALDMNEAEPSPLEQGDPKRADSVTFADLLKDSDNLASAAPSGAFNTAFPPQDSQEDWSDMTGSAPFTRSSKTENFTDMLI